jgi:hypothetical protein
MSIDLTNPTNVTQPATKIKLLSYSVTNQNIQCIVAWLAADGSIQKTDSILISGADYTEIDATVIASGWVGDQLMKRLNRILKQKIKTIYNVDGTVSGGF